MLLSVLRAALLALLAAAAAGSVARPTPCQPHCACSTTTYTCRGFNMTAFPEDMFQGWGSLELIDLSYNKATELPAGLFRGLPALQELQLSGNLLASLPAGWLSGLGALSTLGLSNLPLNSTFDARGILGPLPALTGLYLDGSTLGAGGGTCPDLSPLASLAPKLATLSAAGRLTSIPPRSFSGLNLSTLTLSHSQLSTLTNRSFEGLQAGEVHLAWCSIAAIEADAFLGLTAGNVDLYFNQITVDSLPEGGLLLPGVSALALAGNPFDARVFAKPLFGSAPKLLSLDCMGASMGLGPYIGELPSRAFAAVPTLQTLQLFNSGISGFAPGAFEGLPALTSLNIGFNLGFTALPAGLLDPLPTLRQLVVNNGGLVGAGALLPSAFEHTPLLELLDLSWNTGISSLPAGLLAGLDRLATIDLTFQGAGNLQLAPRTFVGINASGTLQAPVSITLVRNQMKAYAGFTTDADIAAAVCAEANAWPATCSVAWSPQAQD